MNNCAHKYLPQSPVLALISTLAPESLFTTSTFAMVSGALSSRAANSPSDPTMLTSVVAISAASPIVTFPSNHAVRIAAKIKRRAMPAKVVLEISGRFIYHLINGFDSDLQVGQSCCPRQNHCSCQQLHFACIVIFRRILRFNIEVGANCDCLLHRTPLMTPYPFPLPIPTSRRSSSCWNFL